MLNQRQFRNNIFETLTEIKTVDNGNEKTIAFCKETEMFYKWEDDGSLLVADDYFILITGMGGNTRWVQITVSKEYVDGYVNTYTLDFLDSDWTWDITSGLYLLELNHNLNSEYPDIRIWDDNKQIHVHEIEIINSNVIRTYVPDGDQFSGKLIVTRL